MKELHKAVKKVFEEYHKKYVNVFNCLYPAKNSTGFPERNLSVNFSKAIEEVFTSACTWFEFQFGPKNNFHFDAIIIIPEVKTILIVESKRFSNPISKIEEIKNDMDRINKVKKEYFCEFDERIPKFADYSVCGVILADEWTETKRKKEVKESFERGNFIETFLPSIDKEHFHNGSYYAYGFDGVTDYQWVNNNYYLVSMIWEVL